MPEERIRVVSYRRVFKTDWRVMRVWEFDLTKLVPGGVPVIPALWVTGVLVCMWVLSHVPPTEYPLSVVPTWMRYITVGILVVFWVRQETPDGRSIHAYAASRLRLALQPAEPAEPPWTHWDAELPVRWDASGASLHRARVTGPARVTFRARVALSHRKGALVARRASGGPETTTVVVQGGERLEVHG